MRKGWTTYWNTTSRAFQLWNYFVSIRYKPALSGNLRGLVHNNVSCCFLRRTCQERRDASYLYFAEKFSIVVVCVRCPCDPVPSLWEFFKHKPRSFDNLVGSIQRALLAKSNGFHPELYLFFSQVVQQVVFVLLPKTWTFCVRGSAFTLPSVW